MSGYNQMLALRLISHSAVTALTELLDTKDAQIAALQVKAEAWDANRVYDDLMSADGADPTADNYRPATDDEIIAASIACQKANARAREVTK